MNTKRFAQSNSAARSGDEALQFHAAQCGTFPHYQSSGKVGSSHPTKKLMWQVCAMRNRKHNLNLPTLAFRLRELRAKAGKTQMEVADAIGWDRATLTKVETDGDQPGLALLIALAQYYRTSLDFLVNGTPLPVDPSRGEIVEDPDELALVRFWRGIGPEAKRMLIQMMQPPSSAKSA